MAVPAYATDLTDILTDMPSSVGWTLISSGGGGASSFSVPETDDYVQGANSISRNPFSASIRGMVYNVAQTIPAGDAVFMWWKADVAQSLATEAAGGVQIIIGSSTLDYKAYYVAGSDTYQLGGWRCSVIDPTTTPSVTVGAPTAVTSFFGVRWNVPGAGPSKGFPFKIDAFRRGRSATVTLGEIADPATWTKLGAHDGDTIRRWGIASPTDTGVQIQGVVNWGSAAALVYSRDANKTIVLLGTKGFTATSLTSVVIQNASTDLEWDNISFAALGALNRGTFSVLNNAKAWLTNCSFADMDTIVGGGTNTKFDGSKFLRCNAITVAATPGSYLGIQVLGSTVALNTSALVWNSATTPNGKLDGSTFTKGTLDHHAVEFGLTSPTAISLTNMVFTGFNAANNVNGSVLHIKRTTGTVTITLSGTPQPSFRTDGATVVFVTGAVTTTVTTVTAAGIPVGSCRVLLLAAAGSGTLPANVTVTIANASTTATVTHTAHGLATNDLVRIKGASHIQNRGVFTITVTGVNTYTYTMGSAPGSNPTGTITSTFVFISGISNASTGVISMTRSIPASQSVSGVSRKASVADVPKYKTGPIAGTVSSSTGASFSAVMIPDE